MDVPYLNLCQTLGVPVRLPNVSSCSGVLESNRRTSDPDTTCPILQVPISGRADFVFVHHLVVVRHWMWMLQKQFGSSRNPLQMQASPDAVERTCF